jgi:hypothetical protein
MMKRNKNRVAVVKDGGAARAGGGVAARELARRKAYAGMLALACAGVVAGAVLTKLLLRAKANRRWDRQVERFRAQGAL